MIEKDMVEEKENNVNIHIKMLEAQELERQRIARDLHDSTVQNLTNCVHKLEYISKIIDTDPERSKMELIMLEKNTRTVINEMREIIYNLRPMSFEDIGIDVTIERELIRLENIGNIKINYTVNGKADDNIKPVISLTIFRIVQEACNNAIKHSKASSIDVVLNYNSNNIELSISDDGVGFDLDLYDNNNPDDINSGFGLSMMKEIVFLLSGKFNIKSSKNKGTIINVVVPLK